MVPSMKLLLLAAALAGASADDEGWTGVFALEPGADYAWLAQKVDGAYADPGMKLVAVGVADGTVSALEGVAAEARALLEGDCADVAFGGAVGVGACSALAFDETVATTTFRVVAPDGGLLAFFAARAPTDFERDSHYLKDALGGDVEPAAELNGPGGGGGGGGGRNLPRAWRNSMLATALVLLCTFVGILGRLPFKNVRELRADAVIAYSSALAAGALLGCAARARARRAARGERPAPSRGRAPTTDRSPAGLPHARREHAPHRGPLRRGDAVDLALRDHGPRGLRRRARPERRVPTRRGRRGRVARGPRRLGQARRRVRRGPARRPRVLLQRLRRRLPPQLRRRHLRRRRVPRLLRGPRLGRRRRDDLPRARPGVRRLLPPHRARRDVGARGVGRQLRVRRLRDARRRDLPLGGAGRRVPRGNRRLFRAVPTTVRNARSRSNQSRVG